VTVAGSGRRRHRDAAGGRRGSRARGEGGRTVSPASLHPAGWLHWHPSGLAGRLRVGPALALPGPVGPTGSDPELTLPLRVVT
jgi:hypothetical protein